MLRRCGGRQVTSSPPMRIVPASGSSSPATMRRMVLLPQPDGPSSDRKAAVLDRDAEIVDRDERVEALGQSADLEVGHVVSAGDGDARPPSLVRSLVGDFLLPTLGPAGAQLGDLLGVRDTRACRRSRPRGRSALTFSLSSTFWFDRARVLLLGEALLDLGREQRVDVLDRQILVGRALRDRDGRLYADRPLLRVGDGDRARPCRPPSRSGQGTRGR